MSTGLFEAPRFVSDKFIFGYPLKRGSQGNIVEFMYGKDTTAVDVEFAKGTCGCTDVKILKDRIQAKYNDGTDEASFEGHSISHAIPIEKSIRVFFKDGKDLYVTVKGKKNFNPEKEQMTLRFYGNVTREGVQE